MMRCWERSLHRVTLWALAASASTLTQTSRMFATGGPTHEALVRNAFACGLIGDALALGGHYEYDVAKIRRSGGYTDFSPPGTANNGIGWGTANYHPGKKAGDLTDAGEVAIMLLEFLVVQKKSGQTYNFDGFALYWKQQIDNGYGSCNFQSVGRDSKGCPPGTKPGYINGGSRRTLQNLASYPHAAGQTRKLLAADVNCLVAATHFLPLFLVEETEEKLVHDAVSTVFISHKNTDPVAAAEFLARALFRIIHERMPLETALLEAAAATKNPNINKWLNDAMRKVAESLDPATPLSQEEFVDDIAITSMSRLWDVGKSEPIKIGKASPTEGALPSALYFALKYQHDIEAALIANANCGGDSAARGIVVGMLLGASGAVPPTRWTHALNDLPRVTALMNELTGTSNKEEL